MKPSPYYLELAPPRAIASLVDAFWCFSTSNAAVQSYAPIPYRVLPDGCMDLIFQCERSQKGEINNPQLTIYGTTDRFALFHIQPATEVVGIRFHPGRAGQFFNLNAIEVFQQEVKAQDCSALFGKIFDQLCTCSSTAQALETLQTSLLALQRVHSEDVMPLSTCEALRLIASSKGQMSVSQIAATIGVSERTVRRGVTTAVGLSPKVLARILRFQNTMTHLRSPKPSDLCSIALECGYADQAHMIREFQQLAGLAPTAFMP
jgi:AraC-like DNA-binding protein